jgi:hypothetical protein
MVTIQQLVGDDFTLIMFLATYVLVLISGVLILCTSESGLPIYYIRCYYPWITCYLVIMILLMWHLAQKLSYMSEISDYMLHKWYEWIPAAMFDFFLANVIIGDCLSNMIHS